MAIAEHLRRSAPAALRNRQPIADVLAEWLPESGLVVEIACGTGEHAVHFAARFPQLRWQPSDLGDDELGSIRAWRAEVQLPNLLEPVRLDASSADWPMTAADAILCTNMAHISPWSATLGLLEGARRLLPPAGPLILYGPWLADDIVTAPSNAEFDAQLRGRNPSWGIRRIEDLKHEADRRGLALIERRAMPANNFMLLLRRMRQPR